MVGRLTWNRSQSRRSLGRNSSQVFSSIALRIASAACAERKERWGRSKAPDVLLIRSYQLKRLVFALRVNLIMRNDVVFSSADLVRGANSTHPRLESR